MKYDRCKINKVFSLLMLLLFVPPLLPFPIGAAATADAAVVVVVVVVYHVLCSCLVSSF